MASNPSVVDNQKNVLIKSGALNCIENLLVLDEITIDKYELLNKVVEMFGPENIICLGDGIAIKLVDEIQD